MPPFHGIFGLFARASLMLGLMVGLGAAMTPQPTEFHHTAWNDVGSVFDIKQSADGYLWLTTSRGVLRFDGVRFQTIEDATLGAVQDRDIDSVFVSSSSGLWLSTESAGLLLWKDGRVQAFPDRHCTPTRKMGQVVEDRDGSLWVQGAAGLSHLRGSVCEQAGREQGYPGGFAAGLLLDSRGTLWVKTRSGLLLFRPHGQAKFQVNKEGEGISTSYAFLREAPDGSIWLSDDEGLRRVAGGPPLPKNADSRNLQNSNFTFAPDGTLWAVTSKGVQRFARFEQVASQSFTPGNGLSSDAVWKVLIDREGVTWVGTNSGLDQLRPNVLSTVALPHAQEREFGVAAGENGSLWTGNNSLPLTHVSADGALMGLPQVAPIHQIVCIRRDHNGTIWVAGTGPAHLWRSSSTGFSAVPYPDEKLDAVVSVAVDRDDAPWITTRGGRVYRFVDGAWSNQNKALHKKPGVIGAMTDDEAGNIWFAFSDKLVRWDGSSYRTFVLDTRNISETTISVRGEHVWLGGPGGVQLFTQGHFRTIHFQTTQWKNQTLPGRVSGVVETKTGDLWANGFSGITHVAAAEVQKWLHNPGYAVVAERLDELDGLAGFSGEKLPEPSVVEGTNGRLWFATTRGVSWLDPGMLLQNRNRVPPPVTISGVIANGKAYAGLTDLTLPARIENLEIDYTALSLAMPERVQFRYKLEGVDNDWQSVNTRRQAFYTKLRPGPYQFRVAASNNDGVWNETGATLKLNVTPAWFETTWFRLLCLACVGVAASVAYQLRVRQIAARISALCEERLAERSRIARELHDTLLQGFLSASMQIDVATYRLPTDSPARPMLVHALRLMRQVMEEGRNAVQGLRSTSTPHLDLEHAFAQIRQELFGEEAPDGRPRFRVVSEGQPRPLDPIVRDEAYRIGREALVNAFQHAHAKNIELQLEYSSNQLRISVRDDGRGIDPAILPAGRDGHFGLSGMRERADGIGSRLRVWSAPGAGTEVELCIPGRIAFKEDRVAFKDRRALFVEHLQEKISAPLLTNETAGQADYEYEGS